MTFALVLFLPTVVICSTGKNHNKSQILANADPLQSLRVGLVHFYEMKVPTRNACNMFILANYTFALIFNTMYYYKLP